MSTIKDDDDDDDDDEIVLLLSCFVSPFSKQKYL